jgi:hypothetical protein
MEKNSSKEHGDGCMCGMCQGGGYGMMGGKHWMYIVIRIFIVMFIFWAGVQFGELKAYVENSMYNNTYGSMMNGWGGPHTMMYSGGATTNVGWEPAMMNSRPAQVSTSTSSR